MRLILLTLFVAASFASQAGVYVYNGVYQGKDLYVKNPFAGDGVGFCVFEVKVNGEVTSDEVNSSAFAIDLELYKLSIGSPVEVIIRTKEDCEPNVINLHVIAATSTYALEDIALKDNNTLTWTTSNETSDLPYTIEQFKWNKWVEVGAVQGGGDKSKNEYVAEVCTHKGENTFRIRQDDASGMHYSEKFVVDVKRAEVYVTSPKIYDKIAFSEKTDFEVFDEYGIVVAKGRAAEIDCSKWTPGNYYLNFGGQFGQQIKKR